MGTLSLTDPVNGTTADASLIATNNSAIKSVVNGGIDNSNINSSAAIAASKLAGYPSDSSKALLGDGSWGNPTSTVAAPPGAVSMYAGSSAPSGWVLCDGSAISRSTYSTLFGVIGTSYGTGDGSTTFNVPDMRGRVAVGVNSTGPTLINSVGKNDGVTVANRNISHHHTYTNPGSSDGTGGAGGVSGPNVPNTATSGDTNNTDYPAFLVVNFIIKT